MAYELLSQSRKLNKRVEGRGGPNKSGGLENFLKKISGGTLIRDPRVKTQSH